MSTSVQVATIIVIKTQHVPIHQVHIDVHVILDSMVMDKVVQVVKIINSSLAKMTLFY